MNTINPDPDRLSGLLRQIPADKPVTMLNLLKYRETAAYADDTPSCTGQAAYARYSELIVPFLAQAGGELIFSAAAATSLIGPPDESWDHMLLVRYPSIGHFMQMITDSGYQAIAHHRTAALEDSRLVATLEG